MVGRSSDASTLADRHPSAPPGILGQDDFAKGRDRVKGTALRFYCQTNQDIDALAAAIRERGGKLTQEPTDQPWGRRDFAVVDPDGFNISIASDTRRCFFYGTRDQAAGVTGATSAAKFSVLSASLRLTTGAWTPCCPC